MSVSPETSFNELCRHVRETWMLKTIQELLEWDERTMMPPEAGEYRAEQITAMSGLVHQRRTDPQIGRWLEQLESSPLAADPHSDAGTTIREVRRDYDQQTKLPATLVQELVRTAVLGQQAWSRARKNNDFASFQPLLQKTFELKRQQAAALGYTEHPYDPLLDEFEPDAKTAEVTRVLAGLRAELAPFVASILDSGRRPRTEIMHQPFPIAQQESFSRRAAEAIGFSFRSGRLDVTDHPFCTTVGPHDSRITTRYDESFFPSAFFSILHEAGHALYEQGLRADQFGLPPGRYASLGIHESQSRLWENMVGRSRAFWEFFLPQAKQAFPTALAGVSLDDFHFAVNDVQTSLIRVEADEATYNLHIIIRFELEQALIKDDLQVADLPAAWNDKYLEYLGIAPPTDADGVLQDIHWSAGLIGYFPTYALGNLYAAQFMTAAAELGDLDGQFRDGSFTPLLDWLRGNIHQHGQCYSPSQLVQRITGQPLSHRPLMDYLRDKLAPLYGI